MEPVFGNKRDKFVKKVVFSRYIIRRLPRLYDFCLRPSFLGTYWRKDNTFPLFQRICTTISSVAMSKVDPLHSIVQIEIQPLREFENSAKSFVELKANKLRMRVNYSQGHVRGYVDHKRKFTSVCRLCKCFIFLFTLFSVVYFSMIVPLICTHMCLNRFAPRFQVFRKLKKRMYSVH